MHAADRQHEAHQGPGPVAAGDLRLRVPTSLANLPGHGVVVLELTQVEIPLRLDFGGPLGGTGEVGVDRESGDQPQHDRTTVQGLHGLIPAFWHSPAQPARRPSHDGPLALAPWGCSEHTRLAQGLRDRNPVARPCRPARRRTVAGPVPRSLGCIRMPRCPLGRNRRAGPAISRGFAATVCDLLIYVNIKSLRGRRDDRRNPIRRKSVRFLQAQPIPLVRNRAIISGRGDRSCAGRWKSRWSW